MINSDTLKQWVTNNNIEKATIDHYWKYIDTYIKEVEDEYSNILKTIELEPMDVKLYKVSYSIIFDYKEVVNVYLDILYCDRIIGKYEVVYTPSGEYLDEFLSFDDINYIWRLDVEYERTIEIAKKALEEGVDIEFISKITKLTKQQIKDLNDRLKHK